MLRLSESRFHLATKIYIAALIYFLLTRLTLFFISGNGLDFKFSEILFILGSGLLYDTVFYIYALIPISLYLWLSPQGWWKSKANVVFVHIMTFATLYGFGFIAVAEYLFWNEFNVRFNFISVDYLVYSQEVTNNIQESYPIPAILSVIFFITLLSYWLIRPHVTKSIDTIEPWNRRAMLATSNLLVVVICTLAIGQEVRSSQTSVSARELGSNGPYQFFASFRNNQINYSEFYSLSDTDQAANQLRASIPQVGANTTFIEPTGFDIKRKIDNPGEVKRHNIMLVMIESLSADFLGVFGNTHQLTPNLDALSKESLLFTRLFATGTRTTRGLEAVTLSIPPTPGRSIVKRIGREGNMWSLGNILRQQGYTTKFIYGGRGYFDNMNAFFSGNGYDIIDQSSVPNEEIKFENAWGMSDDDLYQQAIKAANTAVSEDKPFFFHIMTTSNHRPYTYPDNKIDIPSGSGRSGAVKFTDWAIGDFLDKARKEPWFDNTVFVFVADHTAGSAGKLDLPVRKYHIPMIIYAPKIVESREINRVASLIDVGPTLLGILNLDYVSSFFGKDILKMESSDERAFIANYQHLGYYANDKISILSPQQKITQYLSPESSEPKRLHPDPQDPQLLLTKAYYQGADVVFNQHLNAWTQ